MTTTLKVKAGAPDGQPVITMEREFDAPPDAVFRAHTDPDALKIWYGPDGFTNTIISMDFRVGGQFRFIMHAPDGTDYTNRMTYREIVPSQRLAYLHDCGMDRDPHGFEGRHHIRGDWGEPHVAEKKFGVSVNRSAQRRDEVRCGRAWHADA